MPENQPSIPSATRFVPNFERPIDPNTGTRKLGRPDYDEAVERGLTIFLQAWLQVLLDELRTSRWLIPALRYNRCLLKELLRQREERISQLEQDNVAWRKAFHSVYAELERIRQANIALYHGAIYGENAEQADELGTLRRRNRELEQELRRLRAEHDQAGMLANAALQRTTSAPDT